MTDPKELPCSRSRPGEADPSPWTAVVDEVVRLIRSRVDALCAADSSRGEGSTQGLPGLPAQHGVRSPFNRLIEHVDASQMQRDILLVAVVATVEFDRVEREIGRLHGVPRASPTVEDMMRIIGFVDPHARVRALREFRTRALLLRANLIEVGFGYESDTPLDLLSARVAATYAAIDATFGMVPIEAIRCPESDRREFDA